MEIHNLSEPGSQAEVESFTPSHRISRKQKLASHMSKFCKEKIDAIQAKMAGRKKKKRKLLSIHKAKPQGQIINSKKLSKIKQSFLKHNPGKWVPQCSKFTDSKKYNEEGEYIEKEMSVPKVKEEIDDGEYNEPMEEYEDSEDPLALPATFPFIKEEECKDIAMDEISCDEDQLKYNLKSEPVHSENIVWLEDSREYKSFQPSLEKDPLAFDDNDKDNYSLIDYSNSFNWEHSDWNEPLNKEKKCIYCGYNTTSRLNLKRHISQRHIIRTGIKNNVSEHFNFPLSVFKKHTDDRHLYCFYCFHCSFFTREPTVLKNHLIIYHKSNTASLCSICDFKTFFPHELNLHLLSIHSKEWDHKPKPKIYKTQVIVSSLDDQFESESCKINQSASIDNNKDMKPSSPLQKLKRSMTQEIVQKCDLDIDNIIFDEDQVLVKNKARNSVVFCPHCPFSSNEPYQILIHLTNEHKKELSCSQCSFVTSKPEAMQNHINVVHRPAYECSKCGYHVARLKDFQDHIAKKHYLNCSICSFSTYLLQHLEKHLMDAHTQNRNSLSFCLCCEYKADKPQAMIEHLKTKHGTNSPQNHLFCSKLLCAEVLQKHLEAASETGQECSYCFYQSNDKNEYIVHLAKKHARKLPLKCNYCNFWTHNIGKLAEHISVERENRKKFFCLFCHFSSPELNNLKIHLQQNHKRVQQSMKCNLCKGNLSSIDCKRQRYSTQFALSSKTNLLHCINAELEERKSQSNSEGESCNTPFRNYNQMYKNQLLTRLKNSKSASDGKAYNNQEIEPVEISIENNSIEDRSAATPGGPFATNNSVIEYVFICPVCDFVATNKEELQGHASTQHVGKKVIFRAMMSSRKSVSENYPSTDTKEGNGFKCFHCRYITPHQEQLKEHVMTEHFDTEFFCCSHCDFISFHLKDLATHIKDKHENEKTFLCLHCSYSSTKGLQDLEEHLEIIHKSQSTFSCTVCHYSTTKIRHLNDHMVSEHKENKKSYSLLKEQNLNDKTTRSRRVYTCCHCNYSNVDPQMLTHHVKTDHFNENLNIFFCNFCDYYFPNLAELEEHTKRKHETQQHLTCPHCCFNTWSKPTFLKHLSSEHEIEFLFDCSYCSYRTAKARLLQEHTLREHKTFLESWKAEVKIIYSCPLCDSCIANEEQLQEHVILEHAKMKFFCSYCSYCSDNLSTLQCHVTCAHKKGINVCSCPDCDFITHEYATLQKHLIKHSGNTDAENETTVSILQVNLAEKQSKSIPVELVFACSECEFSTTTSEKLQQHILAEHCNNQQSCSLKELNVYPNKSPRHHSIPQKIKQSIVSESKDKEITLKIEENTPITFCSFCDFGTDDPHELRQHKEEKHQELKITSKEDFNTFGSSKGKNASDPPIDEASHCAEKLTLNLETEHKVKSLFNSAISESKCKTTVCDTSCDVRDHLTGKTSTVNNYKNNICQGLQMESMALEKEKTNFSKYPKNIILRKINISKGGITNPLRTLDSLSPPSVKLTLDSNTMSNSTKIEQQTKIVDQALANKRLNVPSSSICKLRIPEKQGPNQTTPSNNLVKFSCYQCNFKTSSPFELHNHTLNSHKKEDKLVCSYCNFTTSQSQDLRQHIMSKHAVKLFLTCTQCSFMTPQRSELQKHIFTVHQKNLFSCPLCSFSADILHALNHHLKTAHKSKTGLPC